ncbi:glycosyltransferase [Marinobacter salinexigens]|uniref:Glycosyltransferase n=2 Tax=Marinobacter salinexigens TaxID=2919747 RepID=A0A5B0VMS5_9GAMM|nr:glycosyltransferase [Marinobacter salinexigens]
MLVVWLLRPAQQKRFPLHLGKERDFLNYLAWCAAVGRKENRILSQLDAWNEELERPAPLPKIPGDVWGGTYNVAMYLSGLHRSKYWLGQLLGNRKVRFRVARWYFRERLDLMASGTLPSWQSLALESAFKTSGDFLQAITVPGDTAETNTRLNEAYAELCSGWGSVHNEREQIVNSVVTANTKLASRVLGRILPVRFNRFVGRLVGSGRVPACTELDWLIELVTPLQRESSAKSSGQLTSSKPFGVNLYGYARGELGIGEDVRMVAHALKEVGVPFSIINVPLGPDVSQRDVTADDWIVDRARYSVNLFCMTGIEMSRYICEKGLDILSDHYNVGLWPWELPRWPTAWHHAWGLVDELWGISQYTAKAYDGAPVPVIPMPLPVRLGPIAPMTRADWNLPESDFLFVFSFDMNSTLSRKNPLGLIIAFQEAFAKLPAANVGLVLKVSHVREEDPQWKRIREEIDRDNRIHLVTKELRRPEVLSLYQCCNCYVSLHRSEGFGRSLAEAQLLGLKLIATGYSGNVDFCNDANTQLVRYRVKDLCEGDYFFASGQQWADPDPTHAADLMRVAYENQKAAPPEYSVKRFTERYCGEKFKQRLEEISERTLTKERVINEY